MAYIPQGIPNVEKENDGVFLFDKNGTFRFIFTDEKGTFHEVYLKGHPDSKLFLTVIEGKVNK